MKLHILSSSSSYSSLDCWPCWTVCCCIFSIFAMNDILFSALSHLTTGEDNVLQDWLITSHHAAPWGADVAAVTPSGIWRRSVPGSRLLVPQERLGRCRVLLSYRGALSSLNAATSNKLICTSSGFFCVCIPMYIQSKLFYKYWHL